MKSGLGRAVRRCAAGALLAALGACGGDDVVRPPVVVTTPTPFPRIIYAQTSFENFGADIWVSIELLLSNRGVLDVTVDWTFPDTWMFVYLGKTSCTYEQLSTNSCPFLISSETKDPKPRVIVSQMLEPGTYYVVLNNVIRDPRTGIGSFNTEAVSLQVGFTVDSDSLRAQNAVTIRRTQLLGPATGTSAPQ